MPSTLSQTSSVPPATPPVGLRRIILTGFMGAGKSTIGPALADSFGWRFLDLDTLIEQQTGTSVQDLFRTRGEPAFRRLESLALARALAHSDLVLALGGGAPETLGNRLLIEQTPGTRAVLLTAPFATLFDRCTLQAIALGYPHRPNLQDPALAEARFHSRQAPYRRLAHLTVNTSNQSPQQVTAAVRLALLTLP